MSRPALLELLLSPLSATPNQFKVTVTQSPAGEGSAESCLPFVNGKQDWRSTLIRTLELVSFKPEYFTAAEQDWMVKAQLLAESAQVFHPHLRRTIGQVLYRALIPPHSKVERLLNESIQIARTRGVQLLVQLKFEEDAVQVARLPDYPWELIHDGTGFLLHNQVGFSRYIAFPAVPPSLTSVEQVNVLLISSGASDKALGLKPLPKKERSAIAEALKTAIRAQRIQLVELPEPTLDELGAYLTQYQGKDAPHLLHFDGHGLFGKRCGECRTMHKGIKAQQCKSCSTPLPDAQGYLLFEDEYGEPDYVSASQLGTLLQQTRQSDGSHQTGGVAALVLSACQSGMAVEGESVFQGTAQNLIYHGVPAAVAMQYSVSVEGAIAFVKQFYRSIGEKNSLAVAVSQGRAMMRVDDNQWYRPVLYLRWQDNEGGQLFAPEQPALKQRIGVPFQAPPLPEYYVDRPEVSQDLKARLLQPRSTNGSSASALMISAIHGLGAIGKSTLATALAHDPEIQAHFSDGIFWATLGQQPNLLSLLGSWIQALGDYNFQGTTVEASMIHLRTLLQEKVALLVVDDAWDASHTQAFLVGGAKCRVLITSRDKLIATCVGASLYSLDVMSPEQSLQLLTQRLGRNLTAAEAPQAEELAEEVGYLPLALELAAAQVADGITWAELLQDLRAEVAYLEALDLVGAEDITDEASSKRISLRKSLNLSIRRLTTERRQQFAWFGVLPEDVIITPAMAATLWNMNSATNAERKARDTLRYLRDKAILLDGVPLADGTATYRLHDMFHDLAKNLLTAASGDAECQLAGLGLTLLQAHAELLNRYRQKTQQRQWHTVPNDGYIHERLIWHLEQAGWHTEIHALLGETAASGRNGWYEARERLGQTASYISDIREALLLLTENIVAESLSPEVVGLQIRYVLIIASLSNLSDIPGEILVALVERGLWVAEQGLVYARQVIDPIYKIRNLALLSEKLSNSLKREALFEALEAVRLVPDDYGWVEVFRSGALQVLVNKLPAELLPQALKVVQAIKDESDRARVLEAFTDKLPAELLPQTLEVVQSIENEYARAVAMASLAGKLPEVVPYVLEVAQSTAALDDQFLILRTLANKCHSALLPQILELAKLIEFESGRFSVLIALTNRLPEIVPEVLEATESIKFEPERSKVLVSLAKNLPSELLPQALQVAQSIEDNSARSTALAALVGKLPEIASEVLDTLHSIEDDYAKSEVIAILADNLPSELLPQALQTAQSIVRESEQSVALAALVHKLPSRLLPQVLETALSIRKKYARDRVLGALANETNKLSIDLLYQVLEAAQFIGDEAPHFKALALLSDYLLPELLPQALEATQSIEFEWDWIGTVVALVNKLPLELMPQILEVVWSVEDKSIRARVLETLADKLPVELMPEALQIVQSIEFEYDRSKALAALAGRLPLESLPQVLKIAQLIKNEPDRIRALTALIHKQPEIALQTLELVYSVEAENERFEALISLSNELPLELFPQVLEMVQSIQYAPNRSVLLAVLSSKLSEAQPQDLTVLQSYESSQNRLEPLVSLANEFPEVVVQAFKAVQSIRFESQQPFALAILAEKLPATWMPQALEVALSMKSEDARSTALAALAGKLPLELLPQALEATQALKDEYTRARALAALLPCLAQYPITKLQYDWQNTLLIWILALRRPLALQCLASLAPVIERLGGQAAMTAATKAIEEVCHWWK